MKKPSERWRHLDKERAYAIKKWLLAIIILSVAIGAIGFWQVAGYITKVTRQRAEVAMITSLITECNQDFDPIYAKATAQYMVENCGNYDPVWVAIIGYYEGSWKQKSKSDKGAEGFFQIRPTQKEKHLSKSQRLFLEYQLEKAIERLDNFYEKYHSVYKMHLYYVGVVENISIGNEYIAKIYSKYMDTRKTIWKKPPPKKKIEKKKTKKEK
jgi:hypothetical protein